LIIIFSLCGSNGDVAGVLFMIGLIIASSLPRGSDCWIVAGSILRSAVFFFDRDGRETLLLEGMLEKV